MLLMWALSLTSSRSGQQSQWLQRVARSSTLSAAGPGIRLGRFEDRDCPCRRCQSLRVNGSRRVASH
jgi:hypothetical protein